MTKIRYVRRTQPEGSVGILGYDVLDDKVFGAVVFNGTAAQHESQSVFNLVKRLKEHQRVARIKIQGNKLFVSLSEISQDNTLRSGCEEIDSIIRDKLFPGEEVKFLKHDESIPMSHADKLLHPTFTIVLLSSVVLSWFTPFVGVGLAANIAKGVAVLSFLGALLWVSAYLIRRYAKSSAEAV